MESTFNENTVNITLYEEFMC